ncbi:hypothetical protein Naga_100946g1 [Nannochloropsis gaditana]|uniref:Uncharacterized protein n=1 Tax=Nannochloropsis gaditana TaxID=72520 RepID=W7TIT1_9STRA|nr:hypothetical protein Naga_100946g1 [Nannochloropsis gaditana]
MWVHQISSVFAFPQPSFGGATTALGSYARKGQISTLSGRIHSSHQIGDAAVVIGTDVLTTEECLGVGALLYDFVPIEFHPPELMEKFERNEQEGTAEDVQDKAGKGEGERQ